MQGGIVMIQKFKLTVKQQNGNPVPSFWSYRMYSAILEQFPPVFVDLLHEQGYTGISQYISFERETGQSIWTISLLQDTAIESAAPVLMDLDSLDLHGGTISIVKKEIYPSFSAKELLEFSANSPDANLIKLIFPNTTSFKSNGRYAIFPSEELILHSLMDKWNAVFPECAMQDMDAFRLILQGIHIREYKLRSSRYRLKQTAIPGFNGELILGARLAAPMMELWKLLCAFAQYSGIGIKTALGMGGTQIDYVTI